MRALAVALASSRSLVEVSPELDESIARDERELPDYARRIGAANERRAVPAQALVHVVAARRTTATPGPSELLADLAVLRRSLEAHRGARIADGRLAALERRVELFGFHLAKLDVRLHAREVRAPTDRDARRLRRGRRGAAPARAGARSTR